MNQLVSTQIPGSVAQDIEALAKATSTGKTGVLRNVIIYSVHLKLERALTPYKDRKVTMWKAASLAGLSSWRFEEEVKKRKIAVPYTLEDAKELSKTCAVCSDDCQQFFSPDFSGQAFVI